MTTHFIESVSLENIEHIHLQILGKTANAYSAFSIERNLSLFPLENRWKPGKALLEGKIYFSPFQAGSLPTSGWILSQLLPFSVKIVDTLRGIPRWKSDGVTRNNCEPSGGFAQL